MLLSTESFSVCKHFDEETALKLLKDAGFDACDYSLYDEFAKLLDDNYIQNAKRTKQILQKVGLLCNQAHAPFNLQEGEPFNISNKNYLEIVRSIEYAAYLGAKNIIVHVIPTKNRDNAYAYNLEYYKTLIPYCEKFGIKVAVENDFERRNGKPLPLLNDGKLLQQFVKDLNSEYAVACVDIGHAAMFNDPAKFIGEMSGDILKALHVHDNDLNEDLHMIPYTSNINWNEVCAALNKIGYNGDITFEAIKGLYKIPNELKLDAHIFLAKIGRYFINQATKK